MRGWRRPKENHLRLWPRRTWHAVIIGEMSGNITHLWFTKFHTEAAARAWVDRMNAKVDYSLTRFEYRPQAD